MNQAPGKISDFSANVAARVNHTRLGFRRIGPALARHLDKVQRRLIDVGRGNLVFDGLAQPYDW